MNRRISDMLDELQAEPLNLEQNTPLSSQRIMELTMSRMNRKENKPSRIAFRLLVAAAVIAALAFSAVAAEQIFGAGDFFKGFFEQQKLDESSWETHSIEEQTVPPTISQGQVEVMNEMGKTYEESITSNGTTITPIACFGDENYFYLRIRVEAPENVILPDGILYQFFNAYGDEEFRLEYPEGSYKSAGYLPSFEVLEDSDPNDNVKEFIIAMAAAGDLKFNDGVEKKLAFEGLWEQMDNHEYRQILSGDFEIDITIINEMKMVELDVAGLTYTGSFDQATTGRHVEWETTVARLSISPLSAEWAINYTISDDSFSVSLYMQIVMKDGSSPVLNYGTGHQYQGYRDGKYIFDVPIDLDEIDYVLIGGKHKIYLTE